MLETLAGVLVILWLLGLVSSYTLGILRRVETPHCLGWWLEGAGAASSTRFCSWRWYHSHRLLDRDIAGCGGRVGARDPGTQAVRPALPRPSGTRKKARTPQGVRAFSLRHQRGDWLPKTCTSTRRSTRKQVIRAWLAFMPLQSLGEVSG